MPFDPADRTPRLTGPWDTQWHLTRILGPLARRIRPVLRRGNTFNVLRARDVRSVLARPDEFSVAIFAMRMTETMGLTFLGMDPSQPEYTRESGQLRAALEVPDPQQRGDDLPQGREGLGRLSWVRRFAAELSLRRVEDALKTRQEIDVVSDLADFVPLDFARKFFGTPEPNPQKPEILSHLKIVSYYLFAPNGSAWAVQARRSGRHLATHFRRLVSARHAALTAGQNPPDDVLGRLIAAQSKGGLNDEAIARTLGFISGAMMPTSWLFIRAMDRLLRLPSSERSRLHQLAVERDEAGVRAYVIEAARFFPFPFNILRFAERDTEIAGYRIPEGAIVNLWIGSATTDSQEIDRAHRFVVGRPEDDYMLFGHGPHLCQGKDIAEELMTQMAIALFSRRNLRRAPGRAGYISKERGRAIPWSLYPKSLILHADG